MMSRGLQLQFHMLGKKNSKEDRPGWPPPPGTNNAVSSDSSGKTFFKHHLTQKDSVLYDKPAAEIILQMTKGMQWDTHIITRRQVYQSTTP